MPYRFKVGNTVKIRKADFDWTYNHKTYENEIGIIEKRKWAATQNYGYQDRYLVVLRGEYRRWFKGCGLDLNMTENDILKDLCK